MSISSSVSNQPLANDEYNTEGPFRWVFHGNIVVVENPAMSSNAVEAIDDESDKQKNNILMLGRGLKICCNHILAVNHDGAIAHLAHESCLDLNFFRKQRTYVPLSRNEFLCPGFVDLHIHAAQYQYAGTATDRPLTGPEGWLETYAFPSEARLATDLGLANRVYEGVVRATLKNGTTTGVYFATLNVEPCKVLVDVAHSLGQRAMVGKVCMDRNSPENYCQTLDQNIDETKELIDYIHNKAGKLGQASALPLVMPVVTPRFIPTCTPQLLQALGEVAATHHCHITSHISESLDEVKWSCLLDMKDHGMSRSDAEIFNSHGLLTDRCIMAHGVHLSEQDLDILREHGSAVAHCPLSNFFFAGGSLPCRYLMERGNKVGLGTDIAGGYHPSIMSSARTAVLASHALAHASGSSNSPKAPTTFPILDYRDGFYLATLGGAQALGLESRIGTFAPGMEFDAVLLSANQNSPVSVFETDTIQDVFQKLCVLGDDRNIKRVYVQGREVINSGSILGHV